MGILRWAGAGARLTAALAVACGGACGGSVVSENAAGTTGSGGGTASASASSTASSSAASSGGAGGAGPMCGGIGGETCPAADYCRFADEECGGNDSGGACAPRPTACSKIYEPTCGCDHKVYGNACLANQAGVDVDALGGCPPPTGMFGCGAQFCMAIGYFCQVTGPGAEGGLPAYACTPLPAACGSAPSCACLAGVTCSDECMTTPDGGLEVYCSAG